MAAKKYTSKEETASADRVFIFPTLQMNVINYREDENLLLTMFKHFSDQANGLKTLKMATGYFNLQQEFLNILRKNPSLQVDFLTSSPRANGFYRAGRFKKYIPGMYRANELSVMQNTKENVRLHEYENGEWTFHAKGAWVYEKDNQ
jgi:CDP-diacylglycerol--glycerol-3-phosphate 3-phosphatidyltransferase